MGKTTVYQLPNEVLAEIFLQCLPTDPFEGKQPDVSVAPLLLCRICSLWRTIAIHTPYLWTTIGLNLEYACTRSKSGSGFPQQKLDALQLWSDRMGVLSPSISLRRFHTRVLYDHIEQVVSHETFFSTTTLRFPVCLDLNGFSESDLRILSDYIPSFPRLTHLVVKQPGGREHNLRRLRFPSSPLLQRLYVDCYIDNGPAELTISSMFSWKTLTHLCANLELHPPQWRVIPRECINLEHLVLNIRLIPNPPSPQTSNPNNGSANGITGIRSDQTPFLVQSKLRSMTIQALPSDFETLFQKLHFPSLISLRLSSNSTGMIPLDTIHRVLSTTPSIRELHLKNCLGFGEPGFLSYVGGTNSGVGQAFGTGAITLRTYVPELEVLVIDGMGLDAISAMPRDIFRLLDSEWLNRGWESDYQGQEDAAGPKRSIEFVLSFDHYFAVSIIDQVKHWLGGGRPEGSNEMRRAIWGQTFDIRFSHSPRGLWKWRQLNVRDLENDMWADQNKFSLV